MKKSILIASVVALAMGAQAQVTEWYNPFEDFGAYNYVQKQSDGEIGKWFLSGEEGYDKYPFLVEHDNMTKIGFEDYVTKNILTIILDISCFKNNDNNNLNVKFNVFHNKDVFTDFVLDIKTYKENNNLVLNYNDEPFLNSYKEKFNGIRVDINKNFSIKEGSKYVCIEFFCTNQGSESYLSNIEITGNNNESEDSDNYQEYFKYKYFYEPYGMEDFKDTKPTAYQVYENKKYSHSARLSYPCFRYLSYKDIIEGDNGTLTTSINDNDMESNIYVSNNVLYTDEPSSVYIFNAGGILVKTENNTTSVDLTDLKKGVYIAKVNEKTIKFVK